MRTYALLYRCLAVLVPSLGLELLSGCATPARPEQMATQTLAQRAPAALLGQVAIGAVTGGKATNPMLFTEVGNDQLREALRLSLLQAGYLSPAPEAATITLTVGVVGVDRPAAGYTTTVTTLIRYVLTNKADTKSAFDELVSGACTMHLSDEYYGQARLKHTEECAVRNNIAAFLSMLSTVGVK
jgi:hypothetical protein